MAVTAVGAYGRSKFDLYLSKIKAVIWMNENMARVIVFNFCTK
jgi:hypothetical protein